MSLPSGVGLKEFQLDAELTGAAYVNHLDAIEELAAHVSCADSQLYSKQFTHAVETSILLSLSELEVI